MPQFDRWVSPWPRTWPFAVFKRHHTELNDIYWAGAISAFSSSRVVKHSQISSDKKISTILPIPAQQKKRMDFTREQWEKFTSDFQNWTRLAALMSASSYFETYMKTVCQLALLSNPGVILRSPKAVDGISLLKSLSTKHAKVHLEKVKEHVISITKGDWTSRVESYEGFFGSAPTVLLESVTALRDMQKLRNGVGHAFGRLIPDYDDPLTFAPKSFQRLSEARLQTWLGTVEKCAVAIDEHLRCSHIGAFEALWKYHQWDKRIVGHRTEAQMIRDQFPDGQGAPASKQYFEQLIRFYKNL